VSDRVVELVRNDKPPVKEGDRVRVDGVECPVVNVIGESDNPDRQIVVLDSERPLDWVSL
jgi:hypothetical protein